jgi:hypothetical protein
MVILSSSQGTSKSCCLSQRLPDPGERMAYIISVCELFSGLKEFGQFYSSQQDSLTTKLAIIFRSFLESPNRSLLKAAASRTSLAAGGQSRGTNYAGAGLQM